MHCSRYVSARLPGMELNGPISGCNRPAGPWALTANMRSSAITFIHQAAEPIASGPVAEAFYVEALSELSRLGLPFMVAGTYAVAAYTGIARPTKDLDIFCKAGDYPRILGHFQSRGYAIQIEDERWLAKVHQGNDFFDLIFASSNGTVPVTEQWLTHAREAEVLGVPVRLVGPTELVWSKVFIQVRDRYDGADVAHLFLKQHREIDWARLLAYMDLHWEVLLVHLLNFRWIYPSERNHVPRWLMDELLDRLKQQLDLPAPQTKVCRGRMLSRSDYEAAVREWGFADISGNGDLVE